MVLPLRQKKILNKKKAKIYSILKLSKSFWINQRFPKFQFRYMKLGISLIFYLRFIVFDAHFFIRIFLIQKKPRVIYNKMHPCHIDNNLMSLNKSGFKQGNSLSINFCWLHQKYVFIWWFRVLGVLNWKSNFERIKSLLSCYCS